MVKPRSQQRASFGARKHTFLSKGDKSSAGGIDVHAREVCAAVNERDDAFTTSSCSGRAFLWHGKGVKSTSNFVRYRVTHELIPEAEPYFDLESLKDEVVDGAWEDMHRTREKAPRRRSGGGCLGGVAALLCSQRQAAAASGQDRTVWLRFEPFILHVCCVDFRAAAVLIAAARQTFKNVGVQSWSEGKVMLAIWGDEGLEMALTDPSGRPLFRGQAEWLREQVNSRHIRNWAKIDRFTESLRAAANGTVPHGFEAGADELDDFEDGDDMVEGAGASTASRLGPRHFDVVGDVAVLPALPADAEADAVGGAILAQNHKVKVVAVRRGALQGALKSGTLDIIAGPQRRPLMTTHVEFGVRLVVDLEAAFFSPRMGPERQRICSQVQSGERVCVLFAGCGPEAMQLAAKTPAERVVALELNAEAVRCARRSLELLAKSDASRAARVQLLEGDATAAHPELAVGSFDRVLAPRPKGSTEEEDDRIAEGFLRSLLRLLRPGGVCHWYDFVADWEFPACERSTARIRQACEQSSRGCRILRCAAANNKPVAERQYRTVIDFAVD